MPRKRIPKAVKAAARKLLGSLKSRLVSASTKKLYSAALELFMAWLKGEKLRLPRDESDLPPILEKYAEALWQEGESKADLANLLAALELEEGQLKAITRSAWRLYGTWKRNEMQPRCTPITRKWLRALAGCAVKRQWHAVAFVLLVAFDCLLRTSEAATLCMANFEFDRSFLNCLLILSTSKGQTRTGVKESLSVLDPELVCWAAALKQILPAGEPLLPGGSRVLRKKFRVLVADAGLDKLDLQVYSLRRGSATELFRSCGSFDTVSDRGRWKQVRTCRIYVDAALQDAAALEDIDNKHLRQCEGHLKHFLSDR